jgi:hypothetical protein
MRSPVGPFRARRWRCLSEDIARKALQLDPVDRSHDETAELAARVFELLPTIRQQWLTAEKRRLLETVFLNGMLDGVALCPEMRKPFGEYVEGLLVSSSRGDKTAIELFIAGVRGWEAGLRRQRVQEQKAYPGLDW